MKRVCLCLLLHATGGASYTSAPVLSAQRRVGTSLAVRPLAAANPVLPARLSSLPHSGIRQRAGCTSLLARAPAAKGVPAAPVEDETRGALVQTAISVVAALVFCAGVFATRGADDASAWFAAYILEESLSIDNLFVFSLIFDYFQTPASAQPRVLRWGLILAVVLRLSVICAGLAVVERFQGVLLVFAGVLLYSAYGLLTEGDDDDEDLSQNAIVQFTKANFASTDEYDGDQFFNAAGLATPLLLALICVELSDVVSNRSSAAHARARAPGGGGWA
jgi:hypothetical protein